MSEMFWGLPGPRRFLDRVIVSLEAGKHVVLVVPDRVLDNGLLKHLQTRIRAKRSLDGELHPLDIGPPVHEEPLSALAIGLDMARLGKRRPRIDRVLGFEDAPARFLWLRGIEVGDWARAEKARDLLIKAGEHAQDARSPFHLVAAVSPEFPVPEENVRLARHVWWGVSRTADIYCLLEEEFDKKVRTQAERAWLTALCLGLARGCPDLAEILLQESPRTVKSTQAVLLEFFGEPLPPDLPAVSRLNGHPGDRQIPPEPPDSVEFKRLWRKGWVTWEEGTGTRLHPAVCAAPAPGDDIRSRVLEGQIEVLMPQVEQVRRAMVAWLRDRHGDNWVAACTDGMDEEERDKVQTEMGPLLHHVFRRGKEPRTRKAKRVARPGELWREIRNRLAHGDVVSLRQLEEAYRAWRALS